MIHHCIVFIDIMFLETIPVLVTCFAYNTTQRINSEAFNKLCFLCYVLQYFVRMVRSCSHSYS